MVETVVAVAVMDIVLIIAEVFQQMEVVIVIIYAWIMEIVVVMPVMNVDIV
jgi:hypothetical protein